MHRPDSHQTPRDIVEGKLEEYFRKKLFVLNEARIRDINIFKDGSYGCSFLSYLLHCESANPLHLSTKYPRGLLYKAKDALFGVGVFFDPESPASYCFHILAPRGGRWKEEIDALTTRLVDIAPGAKIFIRHMHSRGEHILPSLTHARCIEYLEANGLQFILHDYTPQEQMDAKEVVYSTALQPHAYENIITCDPEEAAEAGVHMRIGYLVNQAGKKVPVSFFAFEETASDTVCGYAAITNCEEERIVSLLESSEITPTHTLLPAIGAPGELDALACYATGQMLHEMRRQGYRYVNFGESEKQDLNIDNTKQTIQKMPDYWPVDVVGRTDAISHMYSY